MKLLTRLFYFSEAPGYWSPNPKTEPQMLSLRNRLNGGNVAVSVPAAEALEGPTIVAITKLAAGVLALRKYNAEGLSLPV